MDRAFYLSLFLSRLGDQVLLFLLPLVVFQLTGSVAWSGAAFFLETLPRFLSFPICGVLCDRINPLRLLASSQIWRMLTCLGGMAGYAIFGGFGWLVAISAISGVLTTQGMMAREVIIARHFRNTRFETVLSLTQLADQAGMVLGPLIAGAALQIVTWPVVVMAVAAGFGVADLCLTRWQRVAQPQVGETDGSGGVITPLWTAMGHLARLPGLARLTALAAAVNLVIGATGATVAALFTGILAGSDQGYALLQAAGAVTTIAILALTARTAWAPASLGILSYGAIFIGGLMTGAAPIINNMWLYIAGFLLITGFDKMFSVYIRSMRMRIIPAQDLGKTTGLIVMLNNLSQPLAGLIISLFAASLGAGWLIVAMSLVMVLPALAVGLRVMLARRVVSG